MEAIKQVDITMFKVQQQIALMEIYHQEFKIVIKQEYMDRPVKSAILQV